jgi:predicted DCC family thiol-disulfide oxidoreductase YuxK
MPLNPKKITIFYDGFCNVCGGFVQFVIQRDTEKRISYAPLQSPEVIAFLKQRKIDATRLDTIICADGEQVYERSTAVLKILRSLPGAWKIVGVLLIIPRPIRDWAYDFFGRRRYKWFGQRNTCYLPPANLAFKDEPDRE